MKISGGEVAINCKISNDNSNSYTTIDRRSIFFTIVENHLHNLGRYARAYINKKEIISLLVERFKVTALRRPS